MSCLYSTIPAGNGNSNIFQTIQAAPPFLAVAAFSCSRKNTVISSHGRRGSPPLAAGPAHLRRPGRSVTQVPAGSSPARATQQQPNTRQGRWRVIKGDV